LINHEQTISLTPRLQLGCSFFQCLASEFAAQDYGRAGLEQWFRPLNSHEDAWSGAASSYAARAVLIDMEPKVRRRWKCHAV